jgi:hypothetical protein
MFPKVLVCCPTASVKNYCFHKWIDNVMNFSYPNFEIRLFDNTNDKGINAKHLNDIFEAKFGQYAYEKGMFFAQNSLLINNSNSRNVVENMCYSHNDCREYALTNSFDYILHLESDIFPETDIIESLMFHKKDVVGANYYIDEGAFRRLMIQTNVDVGFNYITSLSLDAKQDLDFMNGELKKVAAIGLGCVLISKNVLKKIKFRYEKGVFKHPDSYFSEDCLRFGIDIYSDTQKICAHENELWM